MLEVLKLLLSGGLLYTVCYIVKIVGKCYIATICKDKKVQTEKAKAFAEMMSKDINISLHN